MITPLASSMRLNAGALSAELYPEELFLRYVRAGGEECLRGIYLAIRDKDWNTPAPKVVVVFSEVLADSFDIELEARWEYGDMQYRSVCCLRGTQAGEIEFNFRGAADSDFLRNRLGFVVLHGAQLAGKPVVIESVEGEKEHAKFPSDISPHQPFCNVRAMTHSLASGYKVKVLMKGDTFETEDQRNWTDASFKTYCTPLELPFPVQVRAGDIVEQSVRVSLVGNAQSLSKTGAESFVRLDFPEAAPSYPIPQIGLETIADRSTEVLSESILRPLIALNPDHLRVALHLYSPDVIEKLLRAQEEILAIGCALEVALFTREGDNLAGFFTDIKNRLDAPVIRWMVFDPDTKTTPPAATAAVKDMLLSVGLEGPVGAGTDHFFTELNRERNAIDGADFACFSMNPQVHAFDDRSLIETIEMQEVCVRSARTFTGDLPVVVSPVTFKMRSNPNATRTEEAFIDTSARIDQRQQLPFGAVWTLGSLYYLALAKLQSVTLFELSDSLGVMDSNGNVFPLFDAISLFTRFKGGTLKPMVSNDPLKAIGFELSSAVKKERTRVVVNLTPLEQRVKSFGEDHALGPYQYKIWNR